MTYSKFVELVGYLWPYFVPNILLIAAGAMTALLLRSKNRATSNLLLIGCLFSIGQVIFSLLVYGYGATLTSALSNSPVLASMAHSFLGNIACILWLCAIFAGRSSSERGK